MSNQSIPNYVELLDVGLTEKIVRTNVILDCVRSHKISESIVLFSSGNAYKCLHDLHTNTMRLESDDWVSQEYIRNTFPNSFDATSGHLSIELMNQIAKSLHDKYKDVLDENKTYGIMSGSGETLVCMKLAFPQVKFVAIYDDNSEHTSYSEFAPLNKLVSVMAEQVIHIEEIKGGQVNETEKSLNKSSHTQD